MTSAAGVASFRNVQGGDPDAKRHIIEVMGGGAAFLDYDKDGNLDILLVRGSTIERFQREKGDPVCALFRGDGRGHFADVTRQAGLGGARGWGMGVVIADYDNDGWEAYTSQATGVISSFITAETVRLKTWLERPASKAACGVPGAAFADFNRDGRLDLYVANYLDYPLDRLRPRDDSCNYRGFPVFCGPRGIPGARDAIYMSDRLRTFSRCSH